MDSVREQIIQAMAQRMQARRASAHIEQLPHISLWDGTDRDVGQTPYGEIAVTTVLTIEAVYQADNNPEQWSQQGNRILAELITRATGEDSHLNGLADSLNYTGGTLYYPEPGSDVIGADLNIEIRWRHKRGNPYQRGD